MAWQHKNNVMTRKKVLIIEDDELIRRMYEQVFLFNKYDVLLAVDGVDGLDKARTQGIDMILLDIMMPSLNGLDMLRKLKAIPELAKTPVVVLTNLLGAEYAQQALAAGALRYICKSDYSPKEIADMVFKLLPTTAEQYSQSYTSVL